MVCPSCGHANLAGADMCEACHVSLVHVITEHELGAGLEASIEHDPVYLLRPAEPVAVSPHTTVAEVVRLLAHKNIGCVLVTFCDSLLGIFSERDALLRIGDRLAEVADQPIRHFMTPAPETLGPRDSIAFALNRMGLGHFRHVPVEENEKAVGVISVRDVLGYITNHFPEILADTN